MHSSNITLHNAPRPASRPSYRPRNIRVEVDRYYHPRYIVPRPISIIRNLATVVHRQVNIFEPAYCPRPVVIPQPVIYQPTVITEPVVVTDPYPVPVVVTGPVDDTYASDTYADNTYADEYYYEDEDYLEQSYPYNLNGTVYGYDETGGLYIYSGEPEISIINTGWEDPQSGDGWMDSFGFDSDSDYDFYGPPEVSKCFWCNWGIPFNGNHSHYCRDRLGYGGEDFLQFDWLFWSLGFEW